MKIPYTAKVVQSVVLNYSMDDHVNASHTHSTICLRSFVYNRGRETLKPESFEVMGKSCTIRAKMHSYNMTQL